MKVNQNEELQSRREFFKSAAKAALPVIGAIVLANVPEVVHAAGITGCGGSCRSYCTAQCQTTCKGLCDGGCGGGCGAGCTNGCKNGCKSSNK